MKWFYKYHLPGIARPWFMGPYSDESTAQTLRDASVSGGAIGTFGDPFQAADGYLDTLPVAIVRTNFGGIEMEVWSDGYQSPVA